MHLLRLVFKNLKRHTLRLSLTVLGMAIAIMAFGLMRTVVTAWYAGVDASNNNRVITRHAVSFIFPLPLSYRDRIAQIPGVTAVTYSNWFGGVYIDPKNFFPRLAIDPDTYFDLYPEFIPDDPGMLDALKRTRNGCFIGRKLASQYHLAVGEKMHVEGDIYPGTWEFDIVGIYHGRDKNSDETQMFFNWKYLDETLQQTVPIRAGHVGWYVLQVKDAARIPAVSEAIDNEFANSEAETKTETERAFQQSFVSMSGAILTIVSLVSYVIVGIMFLVLVNTMVMTARERVREYAVLKTIGFTGRHLAIIIAGEALLVALTGGAIGLLLTYPVCAGFSAQFPTFFPVFNVEPSTVTMAIIAAVFAGAIASIMPLSRALRTSIVDGLRQLT